MSVWHCGFSKFTELYKLHYNPILEHFSHCSRIILHDHLQLTLSPTLTPSIQLLTFCLFRVAFFWIINGISLSVVLFLVFFTRHVDLRVIYIEAHIITSFLFKILENYLKGKAKVERRRGVKGWKIRGRREDEE